MAKAKAIKRPIEEVGGNIKKAAWAAVIGSLAIIIFGILLVAWPGATVTVIANILGAIFIVSGIYQIINYFVSKGQYDVLNNDLLIGTISLLLGIAVLVIGDGIANIFWVIIGVWMIYESLVRVNASIKLHAAGVKAWGYVLVLALIMLVLGLFVTFNANAATQLIGAIMIASGIIGIIDDFALIHNVNKVIDAVTAKIDATTSKTASKTSKK